MRAFFVTPEEPFHLPVFFDRVLQAGEEQVAGIAIVRALYKGQTWISQSRRFVKAFGLISFVQEASCVAGCRALDLLSAVLPLPRFYSVKAVAGHYGCKVLEPDDINAPSFLATLRQIAPDVIVSVSSPQIFRDALIDLPRLGCLNVHGALLPKYRGVLPSFWMLANDEKKAGVTVHFLNKGIDDGMIIVQRDFDIAPEDSLHSLIAHSKRVAADALLEALQQLADDTVCAKPNRLEEGSYYSWPTREAVHKFRALGRRFR